MFPYLSPKPAHTEHRAPNTDLTRGMNRRRFLAFTASVSASLAVGCRNGFSIFGYQAGADALYDKNIRTVYVPIFNNRAFQTTPYRGFEVDLTEAVVREIGKTTAFRVSSDYGNADTELLGNVVSIAKQKLNINQLNQTREIEIDVSVDVLWRDLRDGTILSNPRPRPAAGRGLPNPQIDAPPPPFDPDVPVPPDPNKKLDQPLPVRIVATGRVIPELGETIASGTTSVQKQIAVQVVSMMERRW